MIRVCVPAVSLSNRASEQEGCCVCAGRGTSPVVVHFVKCMNTRPRRSTSVLLGSWRSVVCNAFPLHNLRSRRINFGNQKRNAVSLPLVREVGLLSWYMVMGAERHHSRWASSVLGASFFSSSDGVNQPKKDVFMLFMASFWAFSMTSCSSLSHFSPFLRISSSNIR